MWPEHTSSHRNIWDTNVEMYLGYLCWNISGISMLEYFYNICITMLCVCKTWQESFKIWTIFRMSVTMINGPAPTATEQVNHIVGCSWKEEEVMDGRLDFRKQMKHLRWRGRKVVKVSGETFSNDGARLGDCLRVQRLPSDEFAQHQKKCTWKSQWWRWLGGWA